MALRVPGSGGGGRGFQTGVESLDHELMGEMASSLGRAGERVEKTLLKLKDAAGAERETCLKDAAVAVHGYFIQRELCGLRRHADAIAFYNIPKAVLARLGAA